MATLIAWFASLLIRAFAEFLRAFERAHRELDRSR
jgi:hypothetical protein